MHDAQPVDDDDVARPGDEPEALVAVIARAVQPCQKSIALVNALPVGEVAEENEAARLHGEDVEDLGLVRDVLLEAESLSWPLQEDGVAQGLAAFTAYDLYLSRNPRFCWKDARPRTAGPSSGAASSRVRICFSSRSDCSRIAMGESA